MGVNLSDKAWKWYVEQYTAMSDEINKAQADLDALIAKAPAGELKDKLKSSSSSETEFSKNLKQLNMEKEALESEMELDPGFRQVQSLLYGGLLFEACRNR